MSLFTKTTLAGLGEVKNRMALAPLTRARATPDGVVGAHHAKYYQQRSTAGLVISEATHISPQAVGWFCAPGIWTEEQTEAWKPVTKAVHDAGSVIVLQLWHTGRASHPDFHDGKLPVAPSAIAITGDDAHTRVPPKAEKKAYGTPRALELDEMPKIVQEYKLAAENAKVAGFDGVEIHNANGYLLDEFIQSATNKRTDKYGGSLENRLRLTSEVIDAVTQVFPADKVGIRFSPNGSFNGMGSEDYIETFNGAIQLCASKKLGYIHLMDGLGFGFHQLGEQYTLKMARENVEKLQGKDRVTKIIGNCGHTKESGMKEVDDGNADMIAYGRAYIANPDLPRRFKENLEVVKDNMADWNCPLAEDQNEGYTSFPTAP